MRIFLSLLFLLAANALVRAQYVQHRGYYISLSDDTVRGAFQFPKNESPAYSGKAKYLLHWEVQFVDSAGTERMLYPGDVKEYVIMIDGEPVVYVSRKNEMNFDSPSRLSNENIFLRVKVNGQLSMYLYKVFDADDVIDYYYPVNPGEDRQYIYVFQHRNRAMFMVRTSGFANFRKDWIYYLDYPELIARIKKKEFDMHDSYEIVSLYNEWKRNMAKGK